MLARAMGERGGKTSELGLIEQIRKGFARPRRGAVRLGIGDDAALLRPREGMEIVVTTDLMLEGRHFRRDLHAPESVGHRCIARGLSDIAAMGAEPIAAFLSLGLPPGTQSGADLRWFPRFLRGFARLADASGTTLAGGDTGEVVGDEMVADIVLVGQAPRGTALRRSGAKVGDGIYVTGALGGSAAELDGMLRGRRRRERRSDVAGAQPQSYPEPRLKAGMALRRRGLATACIDVSDGLSTDLRHLCKASGVGAEIWAERLPVHSLAVGAEGLRWALHGGEDYELLFTASGRVPQRVGGVAVTRIGEVVRGRGVRLVRADGGSMELEAGGWEHFRGCGDERGGAGKAPQVLRLAAARSGDLSGLASASRHACITHESTSRADEKWAERAGRVRCEDFVGI